MESCDYEREELEHYAMTRMMEEENGNGNGNNNITNNNNNNNDDDDDHNKEEEEEREEDDAYQVPLIVYNSADSSQFDTIRRGLRESFGESIVNLSAGLIDTVVEQMKVEDKKVYSKVVAKVEGDVESKMQKMMDQLKTDITNEVREMVNQLKADITNEVRGMLSNVVVKSELKTMSDSIQAEFKDVEKNYKAQVKFSTQQQETLQAMVDGQHDLTTRVQQALEALGRRVQVKDEVKTTSPPSVATAAVARGAGTVSPLGHKRSAETDAGGSVIKRMLGMA